MNQIYQGKRGESPQPEKCKCGCPPASDRGGRRCVRFGQIFAGTWCFVCRGFQTISGVTFYLYKKAYDRSGESTGGRGVICPGSFSTPSASGNTGDPQYVWNRNRTFEQLKADVFETGIPPLSEWTLHRAYVKSSGRAGNLMSGVRGKSTCTECGRTCL